MTNTMRLCAQSPTQPEFSLCGDAFDIADTEDDEAPWMIALAGEQVTCEVCREAIKEIIERYTIGGKARW